METSNVPAHNVSLGETLIMLHPVTSRGFVTFSQAIGTVVFNDVKSNRGSVGIKITKILRGDGGCKIGDTVYQLCQPYNAMVTKVL